MDGTCMAVVSNRQGIFFNASTQIYVIFLLNEFIKTKVFIEFFTSSNWYALPFSYVVESLLKRIKILFLFVLFSVWYKSVIEHMEVHSIPFRIMSERQIISVWKGKYFFWYLLFNLHMLRRLSMLSAFIPRVWLFRRIFIQY